MSLSRPLRRFIALAGSLTRLDSRICSRVVDRDRGGLPRRRNRVCGHVGSAEAMSKATILIVEDDQA